MGSDGHAVAHMVQVWASTDPLGLDDMAGEVTNREQDFQTRHNCTDSVSVVSLSGSVVVVVEGAVDVLDHGLGLADAAHAVQCDWQCAGSRQTTCRLRAAPVARTQMAGDCRRVGPGRSREMAHSCCRRPVEPAHGSFRFLSSRTRLRRSRLCEPNRKTSTLGAAAGSNDHIVEGCCSR